MPTTPIADESAGGAMLYSSGTTGRPKGVKRAGVAGANSRSTRPTTWA
jgi:acyl-coenzyme A synthetase/AMP-(fatty) acid ligase